jgi:hypothetical protein
MHVQSGSKTKKDKRMKSQYLLWPRTRGVSILAALGVLGGRVVAQDPVFNSQNGHWYAAIAEARTWEEAKIRAESMFFNSVPGHLATLTSQEEQDFVANAFPEALNDGYSLGGSQAPGEIDPAAGWSWVTGEPWVYTNWLPGGEPNDFGGADETGLAFHGYLGTNPNAYWNDIQPGGTPPGYVVEWENVDSDGDGIADAEDACADSDLSETVVLDGCDTGVANVAVTPGCYLTDRIADCAAQAADHDEFVSCVAHLTNELRKGDVLSNREKSRIQSCAGQSSLP